MVKGKFYFITDDYFTKFNDPKLMGNSEIENGVKTSRPAFFSFEDQHAPVYWLIPISSKIRKYRNVYNKFVRQHGSCDKIYFAEVLGYEKAFLIQNMFPVTKEYIDVEYTQNGVDVAIQGNKESELISKAKLILALHKQGKKVTWPDINYIYKELTGLDL